MTSITDFLQSTASTGPCNLPLYGYGLCTPLDAAPQLDPALLDPARAEADLLAAQHAEAEAHEATRLAQAVVDVHRSRATVAAALCKARTESQE
ncbi:MULTISPECIES: hypothetical protein [Pseudomonas]|uniref:hypothetical protein n=1 Tax=Pseudomonas TaxID=286 RepID=UPI0002E9AAF8|nr:MULTISPECIES: hypothetical protein [Pseudomonas]WOB56565.1 hypothetical protein NY023_15120 [Pseudomonas sp. NBB]